MAGAVDERLAEPGVLDRLAADQVDVAGARARDARGDRGLVGGDQHVVVRRDELVGRLAAEDRAAEVRAVAVDDRAVVELDRLAGAQRPVGRRVEVVEAIRQPVGGDVRLERRRLRAEQPACAARARSRSRASSRPARSAGWSGRARRPRSVSPSSARRARPATCACAAGRDHAAVDEARAGERCLQPQHRLGPGARRDGDGRGGPRRAATCSNSAQPSAGSSKTTISPGSPLFTCTSETSRGRQKTGSWPGRKNAPATQSWV